MRVSVLFPFLPTGPQVPTGLVGPAGLMVSEPWEQALPHLGQGTALGPKRDQSGCGEGWPTRPAGTRPPAPPGGLPRCPAVLSAAPFHRQGQEAQTGAGTKPATQRVERLRWALTAPCTSSLTTSSRLSVFTSERKKSRDLYGAPAPTSPRAATRTQEEGKCLAHREGQDETNHGGRARTFLPQPVVWGGFRWL